MSCELTKWMGCGDLYSGLFSHTKSNIPEYGQGIFPDTPGDIPESTANFIFDQWITYLLLSIRTRAGVLP